MISFSFQFLKSSFWEPRVLRFETHRLSERILLLMCPAAAAAAALAAAFSSNVTLAVSAISVSSRLACIASNWPAKFSIIPIDDFWHSMMPLRVSSAETEFSTAATMDRKDAIALEMICDGNTNLGGIVATIH